MPWAARSHEAVPVRIRRRPSEVVASTGPGRPGRATADAIGQVHGDRQVAAPVGVDRPARLTGAVGPLPEADLLQWGDRLVADEAHRHASPRRRDGDHPRRVGRGEHAAHLEGDLADRWDELDVDARRPRCRGRGRPRVVRRSRGRLRGGRGGRLSSVWGGRARRVVVVVVVDVGRGGAVVDDVPGRAAAGRVDGGSSSSTRWPTGTAMATSATPAIAAATGAAIGVSGRPAGHVSEADRCGRGTRSRCRGSGRCPGRTSRRT